MLGGQISLSQPHNYTLPRYDYAVALVFFSISYVVGETLGHRRVTLSDSFNIYVFSFSHSYHRHNTYLSGTRQLGADKPTWISSTCKILPRHLQVSMPEISNIYLKGWYINNTGGSLFMCLHRCVCLPTQALLSSSSVLHVGILIFVAAMNVYRITNGWYQLKISS